MKAVVYRSYGPPEVLRIEEVEKPNVPEDGVLIRVHASSVNIAEWYGMTGLFLARLGGGLFKPKDTRLGADFAGVVEAVGKSVTDFKPGDEVFGGRGGAYAEYVTVKKGIAHKPANVTFEEAAAVPTAGITALQGLRDLERSSRGRKS
jgi:NADPH:quinone reductase-like Zn-dependent oxidoreductase